MAKKATNKAAPRGKTIPDERYLIKSTGCEIKFIAYTEGGKEFAYTNRSNNRANNYQDKPNLSTSNEHIDKMLRFGCWIMVKNTS